MILACFYLNWWKFVYEAGYGNFGCFCFNLIGWLWLKGVLQQHGEEV